MILSRVHVQIYGRVQGVFFRQTTLEMAKKNNITGYVRNKLNGTVEALFEGEEDNVSRMIEFSHHGPPSASVQGVEIISNEKVSEKLYQSFSIESTQ